MTAPATSQRAATVEFDRVSKSYDTRATRTGTPGAVDDLSLTVPAGRICVLVGPSGCGKTTTLKMVNRLIEPTSGRILLDGVDTATRDVTELRRSIGYVIQHIRLVPAPDDRRQRRHRAAAARLAEGARWRPRRGAARGRGPGARDVRATLPGPALGRRAAAGRRGPGARRRPADDAHGRAVRRGGPIIRERLQNEFLRLQDEIAKTILFVTHDIDEAIKMGDVVAVMETGGNVAQYGPPAEMLANPASDFVARFVGADRGLKRLSLFRVGELPLRS